MIKYHPSNTLLEEFVSGNIVASVAVIVSSHVEMCPKCRANVAKLTQNAAKDAFGDELDWLESSDEIFAQDISDEEVANDDAFIASAQLDLHNMIQKITDSPVVQETSVPVTVTEIDVSGERVALPKAIRSIALNEWQGLGKISRARLSLDDEKRRTSLLHIAKGGNVPSHTHNGFEITLLLQGSFQDEMDTYHAGDFIWLDGEHTHTPSTKDGCVCLTVSSDSLHFTQGMSQLFNPLGKLIY
jgi:putative transcriptional regulator